ncbi:MAG: DUF547 domain-containing protein [Saprospiraceae bacterium]
MKRIRFTLALCAALVLAQAYTTQSFAASSTIDPVTSTETVSPPSHAAFSDLLKRYVSAAGNVNYAGLKKEHAALNSYITALAANTPASSWSRNEKLAYWINAYNAVTLDLVLDNYPITSITDLEKGKPWDKKVVTLGETSYTLNQIENEIIRPQFNEPRIHFAVNCAAASCPPLRNEAFVASKLEAQLEEQTRSFLRSESYNALSGSTFRASKIFEWYGEDFGDLGAFIGKYIDLPSAVTVEFTNYDWTLNKQ